MPFPRVQITFWLPTYGTNDAFGNATPTYDDDDSVIAYGSYVPVETDDDIEQGRPYGEKVLYRVYLPKAFSTDLRGAKCKIDAAEDWVSIMTFMVKGVPASHMRDATPGDMSTVVELVEYVG